MKRHTPISHPHTFPKNKPLSKKSIPALNAGCLAVLMALTGCATSSQKADDKAVTPALEESQATQTPSQAPSINTPVPHLLKSQQLSHMPEMRLAEAVAVFAPEYNIPRQNTEKYQHLDPNPIHSTQQTPVSTFSIDVDTGSYSNVRRFLNNGQLPPNDAVRVEEFINYFDYNYKDPKDGKPFVADSSIIDSPFKSGAKLIKIGIKGKEINSKALPPANLVFLVDVSGSMDNENKLGLVKHTLRTLTKQLRPEDSITIITYANGEKLVLEPTQGTDANKEKILSIINGLNAGGSTAGEQAIQLAYKEAQKSYKKEGINRILLLTDGDFNVGITDFETLKSMVAEKRKAGISFSTFGFGTGNYNEQLMEQLADAGDGNYSYIDNKNEAKKVLDRQLSSTLATIAQDVKIQVEFNPATVKEYRLIGYENRLLKEEDFNNDKVDAGDIGAGHRVTALYEIVPVGQKGWLSDSRYQTVPTAKGNKSEYAHLSIRYKQPNDSKSHLITAPIGTKSIAFEQADKDSQWAILVAAFAENLKGGTHTGQMDYKTIAKHAKTIKEPDAYGLKAEFIELVEIADSLSSKRPQ